MIPYRGLTVKWSSILCFERSKIWPKVPFYRKFHFIPKNSADFRKSSIFRIFQSLHYFSCFWWISLKFRTFFDKILKFEKFHFANFESFLTESSILSKVPFYPEKPSKVLRPKSSILSWFHFTVRSLYREEISTEIFHFLGFDWFNLALQSWFWICWTHGGTFGFP